MGGEFRALWHPSSSVQGVWLDSRGGKSRQAWRMRHGGHELCWDLLGPSQGGEDKVTQHTLSKEIL